MSRFYVVFGSLVAAIALFQNCGKGFLLEEHDASQVRQQNFTPAGPLFQGTSFNNFKTCYSASAVAVNLSTCLNRAPDKNGAVYTAEAITSCQTNGNTSDVHLAMCLSKSGQVIQDHREAKQSDISACAAEVGAAQIANCLSKRGVRGRIFQANLDACALSDGPSNIERCLRRLGVVSRRIALFQTDSTLCEKVESSTTNLALCLQNADLLPTTTTQAQVDACIANSTSARLVRCLRVNYFVSNVLMQTHVNECNTNGGQAAIATCLDNNGLLPVDPTNVATFQTEVNGCVTSTGMASVAKCLRTKNLISPKIMQPHIAACFEAVGTNAFSCLVANFPAIPTGLTDLELKTCFAANANSANNAARCLATKRLLPSAPMQDHINACARLAGNIPDVTGTRPGQVGIAACLDRSGLLVAPLTQANIDTCITSSGLAGVSTCLHNQGIVPSFNRMIATGGVLQVNCMTCHNSVTLRGNLDVASYTSVLTKVVRGSSATSLLNMRLTGAVVPAMPPTGMLPAATIAPISRWIDQGANDN